MAKVAKKTHSANVAGKDYFYGTGRRKSSVARVFIRPGKGSITVNNDTVHDYFPRETARMVVLQPLVLLGIDTKFDMTITVKGGGVSGQASEQ